MLQRYVRQRTDLNSVTEQVRRMNGEYQAVDTIASELVRHEEGI